MEGHIQRLLKQAEFLAHCEKLSSHRMLKSALFPGWLHKIFNDRRSIETLFVIQPSEISSGRKKLSFKLLESIIGIAIRNEQKSAGHDTGFSNYYHRYCYETKLLNANTKKDAERNAHLMCLCLKVSSLVIQF
jgi:hypothetical protein